jgi:hypothetical protein
MIYRQEQQHEILRTLLPKVVRHLCHVDELFASPSLHDSPLRDLWQRIDCTSSCPLLL